MDGMVDGVNDMVHIQLSNVQITTDLVEIRFRSELTKAIGQLPGNSPTRRL